MEIVRALWVIIFFFFALILMFTWSKINIIAAKLRTISAALSDGKPAAEGESPAPDEQSAGA
jgi:HAMP domain-containing protein